MRKIRLLCVGNIKESFFAAAMAEYSKRLSRFCDFSVLELPEFTQSGGIEKEADAILKNLAGTVVLFDRQGQQPSSEEFAALISKSYTSGKDTLTFVIGGSDGVSNRVKDCAQHTLSFGKITYPHRLMRVIATEQIYRAFTIMDNLPYHK